MRGLPDTGRHCSGVPAPPARWSCSAVRVRHPAPYPVSLLPRVAAPLIVSTTACPWSRVRLTVVCKERCTSDSCVLGGRSVQFRLVFRSSAHRISRRMVPDRNRSEQNRTQCVTRTGRKLRCIVVRALSERHSFLRGCGFFWFVVRTTWVQTSTGPNWSGKLGSDPV